MLRTITLSKYFKLLTPFLTLRSLYHITEIYTVDVGKKFETYVAKVDLHNAPRILNCILAM
jgi:hypothetical protein